MKEQTGETPCRRGRAVGRFLWLKVVFLLLAVSVGIGLAQQEDKKSPEELERERINRQRMQLFAQTQRAAAGGGTGTAGNPGAKANSPAGGPAAAPNTPAGGPAAAPNPPTPISPPNIPAANPPNAATPANPANPGTGGANPAATPANPGAAPAGPPANTGPNTGNPAAGPVAPTPSQGGGRPGFQRGFGPPGAGGGGALSGSNVTLQFPLNPVSDILNIYERLIGKTIIKDTTVFDGPQVSLVTPATVPRDEAIRLIEATLLVNGYVIVTEPAQNSVKVLFGGQRQGAQSASFSEGVVIYTSDEGLPDGESLVGYFMQLEYIDPETATTIFGNHVVLNEFGRITPVITPPGLLITESSSIVRQLIKLRQIIDTPAEAAPLLTEFVELEFAEANIVAQIIQAAMDARREEAERQGEVGKTVSGQRAQQQGQQNQQNQQNQSQSRSSGQTTFVRGPDGRYVAQQSSDVGIGTATSPAAQLIPDDRLNRIMVVASPADVAYILDLIKEFDQPLSAPEPVIRPLNYIKANDILPVIVDVLQDTGTGQTQLPGGRQIDSRPTPVTSSQLATLTGVQSGQQNNQNRNVQAGAETEIGGRVDQIAFPLDEVAPISVLVGKTRIIADRQSNTIIVIGTKENQEIVLNTIEMMDKRPQQVYLATVIGEMVLSDDREIGIDYIQKFTPFNGRNPNDGGITPSLITGRDDIITNQNIADLRDNIITTPFGPASGLNIYGQIGQDLDVIITALETSQNFKVLSRPVVYTQNGKRAEITSGQEVPVPAQTITDSVNPTTNNTSIEYKEVVLKLEVLPTINKDGEVTLDIVQINDRVVGEQLVADNLVPIIGKQELNTTVTVPTNSTIVLGGLITESDDQTEEGFPFIKNIPILGRAAKSNRDEVQRTELMIFIQPVVVEDNAGAMASSHDEDVRSQIGEDAARVYPTPGVPTEQFEAEQNRAAAEKPEKKGFFGKLGSKLFGKKRPPGGVKSRDDVYSTEEIALPNRYQNEE